jgi:hypothetical protein
MVTLIRLLRMFISHNTKSNGMQGKTCALLVTMLFFQKKVKISTHTHSTFGKYSYKNPTSNQYLKKC